MPDLVTTDFTQNDVLPEVADLSPRGDWVLLRYDRRKAQKGAIQMRHTALGFIRAEVVRTGPGSATLTGELRPLDLATGDQVIVQHRQRRPGADVDMGIEVEVDGESLYLVDEQQIFAKITTKGD